MIWEAMERGMAAAAWLVGFVAVAGLMAGVLALVIMLLSYAFGGDDEEGEATEDDGEYGDDGEGAY